MRILKAFKMQGLSKAFFSAPNTSLGLNNGSNNETYPEQLRLLSPPLIVLFAFICLLIIASNGLIIYLICKKKILRSITNMFLTSLAFSDLIYGLVGFPLFAVCYLRGSIYICVSSVIFIRFTGISSVCHVLLVAFDRYIVIVHPLKYPLLVTKKLAIIATIFVWIFSFVASSIQLSWYGLDKTSLTRFDDETENIDVKYSKTCIALFVAVPLVLMCFIYGHIFYISFKHTRGDRQLSNALRQAPRSLRHEWRGSSVLLILLVIFAGCWLPFFLTMLSDHMESSQLSHMPLWLERFLVLLRFIPPLSNPLLCTLSKHDFRCALKAEVFQRAVKKLNFKCRGQTIYL